MNITHIPERRGGRVSRALSRFKIDGLEHVRDALSVQLMFDQGIENAFGDDEDAKLDIAIDIRARKYASIEHLIASDLFASCYELRELEGCFRAAPRDVWGDFAWNADVTDAYLEESKKLGRIGFEAALMYGLIRTEHCGNKRYGLAARGSDHRLALTPQILIRKARFAFPGVHATADAPHREIRRTAH